MKPVGRNAAMREILRLIDRATGEDRMTQEEALDFLLDLSGDLQSRIWDIKLDKVDKRYKGRGSPGGEAR